MKKLIFGLYQITYLKQELYNEGITLILKPPSLEDLRHGTKLNAGLGVSTVLADMDFETYSPAGFVWDEKNNKWGTFPNATKKGLSVVGTVAYTQHPDAEVLCLAYNLKQGDGPKVWTPYDDFGFFPDDLIDYVKSGGIIEAWNSFFEYSVWNNICVRKYGFPTLGLSQMRCAMAKARAFALPGSLEKAGEVLNTQARKDKRGSQVLNKFSIPRNPTKTNLNLRSPPSSQDADFQDLLLYCKQDIKAESEISSRIPDLSETELEFWKCDQRINTRGIQIDIEGIKSCISVIEQAYDKYNTELKSLTNGEVQSASEVAKLIKWLSKHGICTSTLDENSINHLLEKEDLLPSIQRVLQIRQMISSASVKKLYAMLNQVSKEGRLHNLFVYHSARTGRAAGAGPQPQNLPNSGPQILQCKFCDNHTPSTTDTRICKWCGEILPDFLQIRDWDVHSVKESLKTIKTNSLECVEMFWGNAVDTISACLRGLFIAAPKHTLICSDYSAIEAVVLAALAGEQWRLDVFNTHGKIYEMSASKITGIPFEEFEKYKKENDVHHPMRKKIGKVAELASGYQGWIGAWKQFGADKFFNDDEIKQSILAWRKASPAIVKMWGGQPTKYNNEFFGLEGAAVQAVLNPGIKFEYRGITYLVKGEILYCQLLSQRHIVYHKPRLDWDEQRDSWKLSFEGWNTNPKNGGIGWIRMSTYGGKLTENVVQATARDILAHAIINLEKADYPVVLHVHDEIVCEVMEAFNPSITRLEQIMSTMPEWAKGWPIHAQNGWIGNRYRKD